MPLPRLLTLVTIASLLPGALQAAFPTLVLKTVCQDQLSAPTTVTNAGDASGRLFIAEQRGKIRIFKNGMLRPTPFLDLSASLVTERPGYDERGLLGLAFHPDYADAEAPGFGKFYVYYNAPSPTTSTTTAPVDHMNVVVEYQVSATNPDIADPLSARILFTFDQPQFNHAGGQLAFGPDGFLYIGFGDGGSSNDNFHGHTGGNNPRPTNNLGNAQDRTKFMGKILRIDPLGTNSSNGQYGIPASNPFVSEGGGVKTEIYAWGLRNPWRFSFDVGTGENPGTNRLFCADVGQNSVEEIDLIVSGGNYGWRNREGTFTPSFSIDAPVPSVPLIDPVAQYAHPGVTIGSPALPQIGYSVTGGLVYRGNAIPGLQGKYVFADYSANLTTPQGTFLGLEETSPGTFTLSTLNLADGNPVPSFIYCFGQDEAGEIYVGAHSTRAPSTLNAQSLPAGILYKIVPQTSGQLVLNPAKDNTIYSGTTASNGAGSHLFSGNTIQFGPRRALLQYDLSSLPTNAQISSSSTTLYMNQSIAGAFNFGLHRLNTPWGESSSNAGEPGGAGTNAAPGDATWNFSFFNTTSWTAGGNFQTSASATTSVNGFGTYSWSSAQLLADVQSWVSTPSSNHGWLLKGDESTTTAKRFSSRENTNAAQRPTLTVSYTYNPLPSHYEAWRQQYYLIGEFVDENGDDDGDTIPNQVEYAYGFSPRTRNILTDGLTTVAEDDGLGGTNYTMTFRRDPLATDLTYLLQVSDDLASWTTVTTSVAGATATGSAFVSDTEISGNAPYRLVTVQLNVPSTSPQRQFVQLVVERTP
jgi:glucose/arabinose dehydrogenase